VAIPDDDEHLNPTGFDPDFATPVAWAWMYRALGLQVVPCRDKRPDLHKWAELQNELAPAFTFERWYGTGGEHASNGNMGIITGECSGRVFVLDLDIHKHPEAVAWWRELVEAENHGIEPETPSQLTGGGGVQKLFRAPPGWRPPTNRTPIGVDIRGVAGFAVMPPTRHASGQNYGWLPGSAPWEIEIMVAPQWLTDAIDILVEAHGGDREGVPRETTATPGSDYTSFGQRQDGREEYMAHVVWAAAADVRRQGPIKPTGAQDLALAMEAYEVYERSVTSRLQGAEKREGLEKEHRGLTVFLGKWKAAMRHWDGKLAEAAKRPKPEGDRGFNSGHFDPRDFEQASAKAAGSVSPDALFERLDVPQIKAMADPKWLVSGMIIENALGFIYGPPGCLKTFIGLDLALSIASGKDSWWGRGIERNGAVIYISSEGQGDLKYRVMAWERHRGTNADASPFRLIRQGINFMKAEDVGKLLATVQAVADETTKSISVVFVDTVSRVLPGANENLQEDMTLFVAACDAVRQRFGATVVGIHHTARAGNMRGSTVIPGAGDFVLEVRREPGAMAGSIFAAKVKAAEDGWEQFFTVTKKTASDIGGHTSLVLDGTDDRSADGDNWPHRDICRQILAAIDEQWLDGKPWCHAHNSSRWAVKNIMLRWQLERSLVVRLLEQWTANKVIEEDIRDAKNHIKGYRKLADL
jgi:hypothetical protein